MLAPVAELTEVFEHRLRELENFPALREALSSSQRAWLAFREAEGHLESIEDEALRKRCGRLKIIKEISHPPLP